MCGAAKIFKPYFMNAEEMKRRTKQFSINVGHLVLQLAKNDLNRNYTIRLYVRAVQLVQIIMRSEEQNQKQILLISLKLLRRNWTKAYFFLSYCMNLT